MLKDGADPAPFDIKQLPADPCVVSWVSNPELFVYRMPPFVVNVEKVITPAAFKDEVAVTGSERVIEEEEESIIIFPVEVPPIVNVCKSVVWIPADEESRDMDPDIEAI